MCRFTRWCRVRFEIDDIREATVYCESSHHEGEGAAAKGGRRQGEGSTDEQGAPIMADNWACLGTSPIMEEPMQTRAMGSMPSLGGGEAEDNGHQTDEQDSGREREREEEYNEYPPNSWVTFNPPHPPWDDNSLPDQPYQNPYYLLPVKDALWLPMNPVGTLDLDMTVTMSVSLTSEPGAGRLGPPTDMVTTIGSVLSGLTADLESTASLPGEEMSINGLALDGTEEIELIPTIASRVQNLRSDDDVMATDQQPDLLQTDSPNRRITELPTQSTVIQEALNEEREVLQKSRAQREHDAEEQKTPRSWWTSWAFRNRE